MTSKSFWGERTIGKSRHPPQVALFDEKLPSGGILRKSGSVGQVGRQMGIAAPSFMRIGVTGIQGGPGIQQAGKQDIGAETLAARQGDQLQIGLNHVVIEDCTNWDSHFLDLWIPYDSLGVLRFGIRHRMGVVCCSSATRISTSASGRRTADGARRNLWAPRSTTRGWSCYRSSLPTEGTSSTSARAASGGSMRLSSGMFGERKRRETPQPSKVRGERTVSFFSQ